MLGAVGVHGAMKVQAWSNPADSVLRHARRWRLLARDGSAVSLNVRSLQVRSDKLIAEFDPPYSREQIQGWKGSPLAVVRADFPDLAPDQHYWSDLVGCAVINCEGQVLGTVSDVLDLGADPLLKVGGRMLIPFIDAYVRAVDPLAERIVVDWSEDWS